jgi:hypothetical protein
MSGFSNRPKKLRGAFVEYGLSIPPLFVVFQFNPVQLSRNRSLTIGARNAVEPTLDRDQASSGRSCRTPPERSLRQAHETANSPDEINDAQSISVGQEQIELEIRLDATDKLNEGDAIAGQFGVLPQLATLELMTHPKGESLLGQALGALLGSSGGFSFTRGANPPLILFMWGYTRVMPVNISSMNITETEFNTLLSPTRATVSVGLSAIEGGDPFYKYSKLAKEAMSVLNLANIADIANVVVPG